MRYFLISFGVVLLLIIGIVVFNRGSGTQKVATKDNKTVQLTDYTNNQNGSVQMITDGPINASEKHNSVQLLVSPNTRVINVFTGYQGQVQSTQTLPNNTTAYGQFLTALNRALFTRNRIIAAGINPESICPLGSRTHYIINDGGKNVQDLWTASCTNGPYNGNIPLTNTLFQTQFPSYSSMTANINFGTTSKTGIIL